MFVYNLDFSRSLSFLRGGPARLPSPAILFSLEPPGDGWSLHFSRSSLEALFSKQSAMYLPKTGRNLNPLSGVLADDCSRGDLLINEILTVPLHQ